MRTIKKLQKEIENINRRMNVTHTVLAYHKHEAKFKLKHAKNSPWVNIGLSFAGGFVGGYFKIFRFIFSKMFNLKFLTFLEGVATTALFLKGKRLKHWH